MEKYIEIKGARVNNLKDVSLNIPRNKFIVITGVSGSGKSFAAKREITEIALSTNDDIIIIDPEAEYRPLVEGLGGEVIEISATSPNHINALDMESGYNDGDNRKKPGTVPEGWSDGPTGTTPDVVQSVAAKYREHDMPGGWILPNDGYGCGYTDLPRTVQELAKHGFRTGLWTEDGVDKIAWEVGTAGSRVQKLDVAWTGKGYQFAMDANKQAFDGIWNNSDSRPFLWTVMGWSTEFFRCGRHRVLGFDSMQAFVDGFMTGYFGPMDPNNLLCMAWKWQRGDVSLHADGDKAAALGRIRAP